MAHKNTQTVSVNLRLSPALHRQLELVANKAQKPLEGTIKSLLWMGLGQLNLSNNPNLLDR